MITLHPKILERNGEKEFVIISYEEFVKVREELEDYEDLKALREAKEKEGKVDSVSLADVKKKLEI